jgi:hypothetical protein
MYGESPPDGTEGTARERAAADLTYHLSAISTAIVQLTSASGWGTACEHAPMFSLPEPAPPVGRAIGFGSERAAMDSLLLKRAGTGRGSNSANDPLAVASRPTSPFQGEVPRASGEAICNGPAFPGEVIRASGEGICDSPASSGRGGDDTRAGESGRQNCGRFVQEFFSTNRSDAISWLVGAEEDSDNAIAFDSTVELSDLASETGPYSYAQSHRGTSGTVDAQIGEPAGNEIQCVDPGARRSPGSEALLDDDAAGGQRYATDEQCDFVPTDFEQGSARADELVGTLQRSLAQMLGSGRIAAELEGLDPHDAVSAILSPDGRPYFGLLTAAVLTMTVLTWGLGKLSNAPETKAAPTKVEISAVVERIISVESDGNANARNKRSSATGAAQFLDVTWLELIRIHRPDLAAKHNEKELLELRRDPKLAREITARFMEKNAALLSKRGLPVTPGTLYLTHFAGPAGAVAILSVAGDADAASLMAQADTTGKITREKIVSANPFLAGLTVADLKNWADRKMRGVAPPRADDGREAQFRSKSALAVR